SFLASSAAISKPMTTTPNHFSRIVHLLEQRGKLTVARSIPESIGTYSGTMFSCSLGQCRDLIRSLCSGGLVRGLNAIRFVQGFRVQPEGPRDQAAARSRGEARSSHLLLQQRLLDGAALPLSDRSCGRLHFASVQSAALFSLQCLPQLLE